VFDGPAAVPGKHGDEHQRRTGIARRVRKTIRVGEEPATTVKRLVR
jgi:hypothetical protein